MWCKNTDDNAKIYGDFESSSHLRFQFIEGIDDDFVDLLQVLELVEHQLRVRRVNTERVRQERRQVLRLQPWQPWQFQILSYWQLHQPRLHVVVNEVHGGALSEKGGGGDTIPPPDLTGPRQKGVEHEEPDGAPGLRLGVEQVVESGGAEALEGVQVGRNRGNLGEACAVATVGDGGEADGAGGGAGVAEDEAGGDEGGGAAMGSEALGELEHGVNVALARVGKQKYVAALGLLRRHDGSCGRSNKGGGSVRGCRLCRADFALVCKFAHRTQC